METTLYEAAIKGNKDQLLDLVQQNVDILNRVTVVGLKEESPLHIATQFGHVDFVTEILNRRPEYVRDLNSQGQSPLHLASKRGHLNVVKVLLEKDKEICFFRDKDGRTPLQLAAMKGRLDVVEELVHEKPAAAWMLTNDGEPILHLCAKSNQFDIMKKLVELVNDIEFLNMKDSQDNTILHILAAKNQNKMIQFLLRNISVRVNINSVNVDKYTALDLLVNAPEESSHKKSKWILRHYGAKRGRKFKRALATPDRRSSGEAHSNWLNETKSTLLVLAVLIATVTFQAMINPPGGVWEDFNPPRDAPFEVNGSTLFYKWAYNITYGRHLPGKAIMSTLNPGIYIVFSISNQIGFISSVTIILLLISGFNIQRRSLMWVLTIAMWFAIGSMTFSYVVVFFFVSDVGTQSFSFVLLISVGSLFLLMVAHLGRLVAFRVKKCKMVRSSTSGSV